MNNPVMRSTPLEGVVGGTATGRSNSLLAVARYQLLRAALVRSNWAVLGLALVIAVGMTWLRRDVNTIDRVHTVPITSAWGTVVGVSTVIGAIMFFLPVVLPRLIAQDKKERTYELLMATPVAGRSYVGGRYLAWIVQSFGICLVALLGITATQYILHFSQPEKYGAPYLQTLWSVGLLLSLVSCFFYLGICFALYTLLPEIYDYLALVVVAIPAALSIFQVIPASFAYWDPTFSSTNSKIFADYKAAYATATNGATGDTASIFQQIAGQPPDITGLFISYPLWMALGIGLVALAGFIFDRWLRVQS
jgi:ABC-type Na+ efflux pump permease subunit